MDLTDADKYIKRLRDEGKLPQKPFVLGPFAGAVGVPNLEEAPFYYQKNSSEEKGEDPK